MLYYSVLCLYIKASICVALRKKLKNLWEGEKECECTRQNGVGIPQFVLVYNKPTNHPTKKIKVLAPFDKFLKFSVAHIKDFFFLVDLGTEMILIVSYKKKK